ncbi:hypothetical protein ACW95P_02085 [Candidatus Mycoplasma pogonae]
MDNNIFDIKPGKINKSLANKFQKNSATIEYNLIEVKVIDKKLFGKLCINFGGYEDMKITPPVDDRIDKVIKMVEDLQKFVIQGFALRDQRDAEKAKKDEAFQKYVIERFALQDKLDAERDKKIDSIQKTVISIEERVTNIEERVTKIEERVANIEKRVEVLESYHQNQDK